MIFLLTPLFFPFLFDFRFLWRKNATFAISRHYKRFDVFVEAEANKVAGKYDNASIDFQVDFYTKEGLTPYTLDKLPITSGWCNFLWSFYGNCMYFTLIKFSVLLLLADVPEGCVILREHVPISNLFACLWFNEVDRFTSRDQISFSTVRDKLMAKANYTINMFLDCERRNFVVQVTIFCMDRFDPAYTIRSYSKIGMVIDFFHFCIVRFVCCFWMSFS